MPEKETKILRLPGAKMQMLIQQQRLSYLQDLRETNILTHAWIFGILSRWYAILQTYNPSIPIYKKNLVLLLFTFFIFQFSTIWRYCRMTAKLSILPSMFWTMIMVRQKMYGLCLHQIFKIKDFGEKVVYRSPPMEIKNIRCAHYIDRYRYTIVIS